MTARGEGHRARPGGPDRRGRARGRRRRRPAASDARRRRRVGQHADAHAAPAQAAHDVRLEAEVDDGDEGPSAPRRDRRPRTRPSARPGSTKSWSSQRARPRARATAAVASSLARRRDQAAQAAVRPQVARERPRVDPGDGGDPLAPQERRELAAPARPPPRSRSPRRGPQPGALGLVVGANPSVVADQRIGHDHDLAGVRGVGADLLVAGLAGVHDKVAARRDVGAEGDPREDGAVLQGEEGRPVGPDARIARPAPGRGRASRRRPGCELCG